jgi:hypothetical protein
MAMTTNGALALSTADTELVRRRRFTGDRLSSNPAADGGFRNLVANICSLCQSEDMATFEITMLYPERSFVDHRRFLASVVGAPAGRLDGFRRHGDGVALTYVVDARDRQAALLQAHQQAAGMWPNFRPETVEVSAVDR